MMNEAMSKMVRQSVSMFSEEVMEGNRPNGIYEFLDFLKSEYRAGTPAEFYAEFERLAVELYKSSDSV